MRFTGKTALVTGASIGIGLACAQLFAREGAQVIMADIDTERLEKAAEAIRAKTDADVLAVTCDVSDEDAVRACCRRAEEAYGKVDILINNAGLWRRWMPFTETDSSMWKNYIGVNILGTMYFTHELLPGMLSRGYGRVINIASVSGIYGIANMTDYSMTKGAVISFTKALAREVTAAGVTVNCVSPGSVSDVQDTPMPSELSYMGRSGAHSEYAEMIAFLASDAAGYVSGQNIAVDGCRKKL